MCNDASFWTTMHRYDAPETTSIFKPLTAKSAFGIARSIPNIRERQHPTTAERGPLSTPSAKRREPDYYNKLLAVFRQ